MRKELKAMKRLALCICLMGLAPFSHTLHGKEIKIGLRAHRGAEIGLPKWQPTADYLSANIPGHNFVLVPFEINSLLNQAVSRGEFDFVLTNPASHVEHKIRYGVSAIATLVNKNNNHGYSHFGSVIFTRADRDDINSFRDLAGKTFMGVDEDGFGGWRVAWLELLRKRIDPYRDFQLLSFGGGIQQNVVYAVRDGKVDAGSVRTDLLERMAQNGEINLEGFKVLESKPINGFGFFHSTPLYPEWPFAKLSHTPDELAKQVASALYRIPSDSPAATAGKYIGWTLPQNYQPVDDLLKELQVGPYLASGEITWRQMNQYWPHAAFIALILSTTLFATYVTSRTNQRLRTIKSELELEIEKRRSAQRELEDHKKLLEQTVSERTAALKASNKELESYSYSIAHDLRSPLRSIIGFSQILEEDVESRLTKEELVSLQRIISAGKHMATLIDDILELSRITRSQLTKTNVDLSAIARTEINNLQMQEPKRKVAWHIQDAMTANGDSHLLTILLRNLLDNAWKFTRFTASPKIEVGMETTNHTTTVFFVRDNGVGLEMQYADKIFMPFQRLHIGKFEGTGIGLSTVQRVVQRHGGEIWVESVADHGTVFYFTLSPNSS
jgi:signal transduction histidine kinase